MEVTVPMPDSILHIIRIQCPCFLHSGVEESYDFKKHPRGPMGLSKYGHSVSYKDAELNECSIYGVKSGCLVLIKSH